MNAAVGGPGMSSGVTIGGAVTEKVTGPLRPAGFPGSELFWVATAVYSPIGREGLAPPDVQLAPVPVAVALETSVPLAVAPAWIRTVTGVTSLAVPLNEGVVLSEEESGAFNVTLGAAVSTVKVAVVLPVSPFVCVAWAVYVPSSSGGSTDPVDQAPARKSAVFSSRMTVPSGVGPSYTSMVTGLAPSSPSPVKEGVRLLLTLPFGGLMIVTTGGAATAVLTLSRAITADNTTATRMSPIPARLLEWCFAGTQRFFRLPERAG